MRLQIASGARAGEAVPVERHLVVGREADCDLTLDDERVSRRHAAFARSADGDLSVEDLGSTNGTSVNGSRITGTVSLAPGDRVQIGDTVLELVRDGAATVLETPTSGARPPSPSTIERLTLRRSAGRARVLAGVAAGGLVLAVVLVTLFATGVLGGSDDDELTLPEVFERAKPSTTQIRRFNAVDAAGTPADVAEGAGSGWVWDAEKGLVVTNAHVINAAPVFAVRLATETRDRPAEVVAVSPCEDLAVLRVADTAGLVTMPLGSQDDLQQGDTVVSLGFPASQAAGDNATANRGIVSVARTASENLGYTGALPNVIQSDNPHNPGNSGGPLLDTSAELVGVTTFSSRATQGGRYSIGVDRVKQVVPGLVAGRSAGWTGIGWETTATGETLVALGLPDTPGLLVNFVTPGTPAAQAGFPAPSLIVAIDGQPITSDVGAYCNAVGKKTKGETATFSVIPAGATEPVDVTVPFA